MRSATREFERFGQPIGILHRLPHTSQTSFVENTFLLRTANQFGKTTKAKFINIYSIKLCILINFAGPFGNVVIELFTKRIVAAKKVIHREVK